MNRFRKAKKECRTIAPLRIAFAGGGTDLKTYYSEHGGNVLNTTISLRVEITICITEENKNEYYSMDTGQNASYPLKSNELSNSNCFLLRNIHQLVCNDYPELNRIPLQITSYSQVPYGSGLGTSSTICVALIQSLLKLIDLELTPHELAKYAYELERDKLQIKGGCQDHYAAAIGGINYMEINDNEITSNTLKLNEELLSELEISTVIAMGSMSRSSSEIIEKQNNSLMQSDNAITLNSLHSTKEIAMKLKNCLIKQDLDLFFQITKELWDIKRNFASCIIPKQYEVLRNNLISIGAHSCKISGAGGGGFITVFCDPKQKKKISDHLKESNFDIYPCNFTNNGSKSWII